MRCTAFLLAVQRIVINITRLALNVLKTLNTVKRQAWLVAGTVFPARRRCSHIISANNASAGR